MTGPRVVGARQRAEVVAALAGGQVIAVPGDGGYLWAVGFGHPAAVAALHALASIPAGETVPTHAVVGRREQAVQLAAQWSTEARMLTDRMWPGPLTIMVPARRDGPASTGGDPVVHITMPGQRAVRMLCREGGPLAVAPLLADGQPILTPEGVTARLAGSDVAFVVDGGTCGSPGPTAVDCTVSPPTVRRVGAFPETYVDAALMMGRTRRRWFSR